MYLRRSLWTLALLLTAIFLSSYAQGQTSRSAKKPKTAPAKTEAPATPAPAPAPAAWANWDTFKPEKEDFSILMPKDTATSVEQFPYHKLELNARLYLSPTTPGPVVAVASMSGIKSNPAAYTDFERFNSYMDAFKNFFPPKVRKDAVTKMTLLANKPFHGYTGRIYKLTVGDLSGTVNAYVTRKRFYAIAVLNTKKDDALEEKFLSSFVIPDKPIEQPAVNVAEETLDQNAVASDVNSAGQPPVKTDRRKPVGAVDGGANNGGAVQLNNQEDNTELGTGNAQANAQQKEGQPNQKRAPLAGGMLNGKAIYLPLPELPPGEKSGVVMVQILIDEQGTVVDAKVSSGPPNLHNSAINAARLARFMPTLLAGEPVRVTGTLAYNYGRAN